MLNYKLATARAWAEIDVDKLLTNYRGALSELSPGTRHYTVLKANAYGLGAVPIARILYREGARHFAVAFVAEGMELRRVLPGDAEILVMSETLPPEVDLLLDHQLTPTILSLDSAERISEHATVRGLTVQAHCKVDTGLNRLGFAAEGAPGEIAKAARLPGIALVGVYSHLQRRSPEHDRRQCERLLAVRDALRGVGIDVPMLHMLDSIGMWRYPEYQFDAVRDGAYVFGHTPLEYHSPEKISFALSFKTRIIRVFTARAGECLGYGAAHPLVADRRVATLCAGYDDGYPRAMSHSGEVEIHGRRAKVLGVICMNLMMVDVTDIGEARVGDEVTLLGGGIGAHEYAAFCGSYINECLTRIGRHIPRVYLQGGNVIDIAIQS